MKVKPDQINFAVPIVQTLKGQNKTEQHVTSTTPADEYLRKFNKYKEMIDSCKAEGFDETAIVCVRTEHKQIAHSVMNWGVLYDFNKYSMNEDEYKPMRIKWFNSFKSESSHHLEELYLIYPPVDHNKLRLDLEAQDMELGASC